LGLLSALVNAHMPVGKPPLSQAARTAGMMALLGTPIMLALFLFFPRVAPLWGIPNDAMSGRSGLSSTMSVGTIASLALDDSIAMRIRFQAQKPAPSELYFRGPVLSSFDGREWRARQAAVPYRPPAPANLQVRGTAIGYQVTLEPNSRPWLLLLDAAAARPVLGGFDVRMTPDLQWLTDRPITELLRYDALSYPDFRHGPMQQVPALLDDLRLPAGSNPRTAQLAREMRADPRYAHADGAMLVSAVLERLREGAYRYTLDPGVFGQHSADEFWFDRKQGFCEHIASSFVILMRGLGLPARVVTGYQGGETNPVDGFLVVRQSDAHAWAEVWIADSGWVRVDPTTAVAPGRTGATERLLAPRGVIARALFGNVSPALAFKVRAVWEAVNNGWNQWVLNYSQSRQFDLLRQIGFSSPRWEDLAYLLMGLMVMASLTVAVWTVWERARQDPWLRLLAGATRYLEQTGLTVVPNSPPRRLAEQLSQQRGSTDPALVALQSWLLRLEAQRYAPGKQQREGIATLRAEFQRWVRRQ
jgi:transglutaminase-like putative cysteine protease